MLLYFSVLRSDGLAERMTDSEVAEIIARSRDDPERFARIIECYAPLVYTVARGIFNAHRRADLDDAVSETFLKLWKAREQYDPERGSYANYVLLTTRAVCCSQLRRLYCERGVQMEELDALDWDVVSDDGDPETAMIGRIDEDTVKAVLNALAKDDRELIVCKYFYMMRVKDIARRMHRTEKSVEARLYKLRRSLREEFTRRGLRG